MSKYTIRVTGNGELQGVDYADTEETARAHAHGWTGQRGQMTWVARILKDGKHIATYKRGIEVKP